MNTGSTLNNPQPAPSFSNRLEATKPALQGFAKVACILFIILGVLGVLMTIQSLVGMILVLFMDENRFNSMSIFPGSLFLTILVVLINFVVSGFQVLGGVLGLQRKIRGAHLIRLVAGFMLIFKVLETAFGCVINYLTLGPILEDTLKQIPDQPADGPDMAVVISIVTYVGVGVGLVVGVVMFLFYLFTFLRFSKQETLSQFS